MIFQNEAIQNDSPSERANRIEMLKNRNRPIYDHAIWCVRAGKFVEAGRLCNQLLQASTRQGDAVHFYASQFVQRLAGFDETFIFPNDAIVDSETPRSKLMLELNAAMHDFQVKNFTDARIKFASVCDSLGSYRNADRYTACAYNWVASATRLEILTRSRSSRTTTENLMSKWIWIVSQLAKVADRFQEELPHAHREIAWYYGLNCSGHHGGPHPSTLALRSLRLSVISAQRLGMENEEYQTLVSWNAWVNSQDFSVPSMSKQDAKRLEELERKQVPAIPAPKINYRTEVSLIDCLTDALSSFNSKACQSSGSLVDFNFKELYDLSK